MFLRGSALALALLVSVTLGAADVVTQVRIALAEGDLAGADRLVAQYRKFSGVTPELAEALSWLGRGSLAAKKLDAAESYSQLANKLCVEQLKTRKLDSDRNLTMALGAAIEVQAQVLAQRGERAEAVVYLRGELAKYRTTSIRTRIQKNINLLTLEGKLAPPIDMTRWIGERPQPIAALRGRPVLLFFWAHWCPDCKQEAPILTRLQKQYKDLVVIGPTQRYGYVEGGEEASPEAELKYIEQVRRQSYAEVVMTVPVSEENFRNFGASTTPTLVLIDRRGIVRLYHPGRMTYEELAPLLARFNAPTRT